MKQLFKPVDNSPLIVFRIFFGFLIFCESFGSILTGWVRENLIEPQFTFNFIGFEFIQPLDGYGMYIYYCLLAVFALMIMLGWYYRFAILAFALLWTGTYLMQKSAYNNHYYLLILLCLVMAILPANRYKSMDVRRRPELEELSCPAWCIWVVIAQVTLVYTFAGIAKIYPDWLQAIPVGAWFKSKANYPVIGPLLALEETKWLVSYGGIFFDLCVGYLLLWKRSRWFAFGLGVFFHLFNSAVFQIGVFPYLMIALCLFYFPGETVRKRFFPKKPAFDSEAKPVVGKKEKALLVVFAFYFLVQLYLPLRHHLYPDNVLWTEEGHRMAWRMMLRSKSGSIYFRAVSKEANQNWQVRPRDYMTKDQYYSMSVHPDMIWQFSQRLKKEFQEKGFTDIEIYAVSRVGVNRRPSKEFIDPTVDLAQVKWQRFKHKEWIRPWPY